MKASAFTDPRNGAEKLSPQGNLLEPQRLLRGCIFWIAMRGRINGWTAMRGRINGWIITWTAVRGRKELI